MSIHALNICKCTPHHFCRNRQAKVIIWLQQHRFCLHQALPDCPVSGLTKISAFGMFQMRAACCQRNLHIRNLRSHEHTSMCFLRQMSKDQSLPVSVQYIFTAYAVKHKPASGCSRFHDQMYLCIMTKRFIMSHTFYRIFDCFLIYNISTVKRYLHAKALFRQTAKHFGLHFPHKLYMDFFQLFIPDNTKHRVFLFQNPKVLKHGRNIYMLRKDHAVIEYR